MFSKKLTYIYLAIVIIHVHKHILITTSFFLPKINLRVLPAQVHFRNSVKFNLYICKWPCPGERNKTRQADESVPVGTVYMYMQYRLTTD